MLTFSKNPHLGSAVSQDYFIETSQVSETRNHTRDISHDSRSWVESTRHSVNKKHWSRSQHETDTAARHLQTRYLTSQFQIFFLRGVGNCSMFFLTAKASLKTLPIIWLAFDTQESFSHVDDTTLKTALFFSSKKHSTTTHTYTQLAG